jgi:hypothetical protein
MYRHNNVAWLKQLIESQPSLGNMEFLKQEIWHFDKGKVEIWKQEMWKFETGKEKFLNKKFTPSNRNIKFHGILFFKDKL